MAVELRLGGVGGEERGGAETRVVHGVRVGPYLVTSAAGLVGLVENDVVMTAAAAGAAARARTRTRGHVHVLHRGREGDTQTHVPAVTFATDARVVALPGASRAWTRNPGNGHPGVAQTLAAVLVDDASEAWRAVPDARASMAAHVTPREGDELVCVLADGSEVRTTLIHMEQAPQDARAGTVRYFVGRLDDRVVGVGAPVMFGRHVLGIVVPHDLDAWCSSVMGLQSVLDLVATDAGLDGLPPPPHHRSRAAANELVSLRDMLAAFALASPTTTSPTPTSSIPWSPRTPLEALQRRNLEMMGLFLDEEDVDVA